MHDYDHYVILIVIVIAMMILIVIVSEVAVWRMCEFSGSGTRS